MIDNIVMAEPRDFSRDINAAYKKYICMALTNHEMCSRFDDFVISITKTGGVLDFKLHRIFIWKTLMLFDIHNDH